MTLGALVTLAGCGGGGDGASAPLPQAQSSVPEPTPATAGARSTCNLPDFEIELLAAVNAYRAAGASCGSEGNFPAAAPLAWNDLLTQAARIHSDDMVSEDFFSHTGSNGSSAGQRAAAAGYVWRSLGENIAAGQPSVATVMGSWMSSPGHCANIMRASHQDIGVSCVSGGAGNSYRSYWTMSLGLAR